MNVPRYFDQRTGSWGSRTRFTLDDVRAARALQQRRVRMVHICSVFVYWRRDRVVELLDAVRRYPLDAEALDHVNYVLECQEDGIPLINGAPLYMHLPEAMFDA